MQDKTRYKHQFITFITAIKTACENTFQATL